VAAWLPIHSSPKKWNTRALSEGNANLAGWQGPRDLAGDHKVAEQLAEQYGLHEESGYL
jgi:hypothetical protein